MKLFASFTAVVRELKTGSITQKDLDEGFYAFGCSREHAFYPERDDPNEVARIWKNDPDAGKAAHAWLVEALLRAEHDGRILWREQATPEVRIVFSRLATAMGAEVIR
jgi:hypothetical protein